MKKAIPFSLSLFLFVACEKEFEPPFDNQKFYDYHETQNWNSEDFKSELIGEWQLIYQYCCSEATSAAWADVREEEYVLNIGVDSILVYRKGELASTTFWELETRGETAFYLNSEVGIENTFGTIYLNKEYLLFHGSPADGSDSYYERIK
ncbi:hypothetical protein QYS48_30060 [Marivirga arenosa]|uniref:Uncharacterized protein n=1 Tax=Marivirga arenosa TaxID=3059076 RepID=A0AA51N8A4_9BACT|nr:hypothetical protein [Marivirga sp. ABR2-2]WMN07843.1 hypothetical protein QYS48_30060 [Marivirga sp. ABR2-2]